MSPSWIVCEPFAGLQAQALGLAEAAGLSPSTVSLSPGWPWRAIPAAFWPDGARRRMTPDVPPALAIACGGKGGAVAASLRRRGTRAVQVQDPRMDPRCFDLIVANRHDALRGPNIVVVRNALHRVTPARLAEAAATWRPVFAGLPRPLVCVLVGGGNGRYRFGVGEASRLGAALATMTRLDRVGVAVTPSRRTGGKAVGALADALGPDAYLWDGTGDNPYFGMLALADAIVVTQDSVSMISEAVATSVPVLVASLPGRSGKGERFLNGLLAEGRVRRFAGRLEQWPVEPLNDTPAAAAEMRRRLGF